mmetsp:Transcript_16273/g.54116  ORF Transcript_16273/g.54116 Transcript_16273/m.54116 type:complete len:211 (-) Transcript_16273:41-673(-)
MQHRRYGVQTYHVKRVPPPQPEDEPAREPLHRSAHSLHSRRDAAGARKRGVHQHPDIERQPAAERSRRVGEDNLPKTVARCAARRQRSERSRSRRGADDIGGGERGRRRVRLAGHAEVDGGIAVRCVEGRLDDPLLLVVVRLDGEVAAPDRHLLLVAVMDVSVNGCARLAFRERARHRLEGHRGEIREREERHAGLRAGPNAGELVQEDP